MNLSPETFELALRVFAGLMFGAVIGLERQWRSRLAGIRTNALVAAGSALFVVMGAYAFEGTVADPTRVAAQVVSGIGFLGAGVIMREGLNVRGLNTAATLWCAAAIGSLAGSGLYVLAALGALMIVAANTVLRPLGRMVNRRPSAIGPDDGNAGQDVEYLLEAITNDKSEARVRALLVQAVNRPEFSLHSITAQNTKNSLVKVRAELTAGFDTDASALERAVQRISLDPKIVSIRWWSEEQEE
ncbi:MgtC/SapB family protein [Microterricola pindariensis]|nr:MgtC/SapB family protein [Microterricola pindariensis]